MLRKPNRKLQTYLPRQEVSTVSCKTSLLATTVDVPSASGSTVSFKLDQLRACQETLSKIHVRISKAVAELESHRKRGQLLRSAKWPFSKPETQQLVEELSRHKSSVQLALSADTFQKLAQCLSKQDTLHVQVQDIKHVLERKMAASTRVRLDKRRKQVFKFFARENAHPQDDFEAALSLRYKFTGSWLLNEAAFVSWKSTPSSKLWLSGIPGSGKTVLCATVIDDLLQYINDTTGIAYFFCDYKNTSSQDPVIILSSFASQLALQDQNAFVHIEESFKQHHPEERLPKAPTVVSISSVIRKIATCFSSVFIIVDGLDECGSRTDNIANNLKELAQDCPTMHMAIFSRAIENIRLELAESFEHVEISAHREDLEIFVGAEIASRPALAELHIQDATLNDGIRQKLIDGAHGM